MNVLTMSQKIAETLESGKIPWASPTFRRKSSVNSAWEYTGFNALALAFQPDTFFITEYTAKKNKIFIENLNQDYTLITYPVFRKGQELNAKTGNMENVQIFSCFKTTAVYGISRCKETEKVEKLLKDNGVSFDTIESIDQYIKTLDVTGLDTSALKSVSEYTSIEQYYNNYFKLIMRKVIKGMTSGDEEKDEIVNALAMEIGAGYLCGNAGVTFSINDTAAYISKWLGHWEENKALFSQGAKLAFKAIKKIQKKGE